MNTGSSGKEDIPIAARVDARGLFCPMPVVKLKLELEKVKLNEVVEVIADDPGIMADLPVWCNQTGNILLYLKEEEKGVFVARVEKRVED